ncbi:DNA polymerase-3 subunit alpha [Saccharopolyspora antimicrobica]|uniref:DNA polymerase III subunit alpha n=1 Tax=Saccharopolyspora antimicrobica TaxID=455193 RepID=A0A1I4U305_9PSEU|nr:DNA polymerase III subunit alpha [Saccharopolyspora antimicrobica]RKT88655.1 DNA polymerase III alpha subunit [Saccharopolyspora antimicrobica]SFM83257.1 DNA polymerase-3 subunit alpha [Saccharopolyspora antimicrobica]
MDPFVHLHVHTEYSMLDGAAKVGALFAEAERLGMPAVGMTDHGNMFGADEFYQQARKTGIKPVIGIEAYLAPGSRFHKKPVFWGEAKQRGTDEFGTGGDVSGAGAYTHMTMLARNATGLRNLFTLSSRASFEGMYRKPRMDKELIAEFSEGVIATTGCPSGEVQTRLRLRQFDEALRAAAEYQEIFGREHFFLELMDHGLPIERSVRQGLLEISKKLGIPPLATNDSHYVTVDQADSHGALLCVQSGKTLGDASRFKFDGDGYYLKSAEEMRAYWDSEVPGAADNTLLIAEMVESYEDVWGFQDRMPRVTDGSGRTERELLAAEVEQYLPSRYPDGPTAQCRERIQVELDVLDAKGYCAYFLVVGDLTRWAKSQGIHVGPGRGSAAGSLLAYILHITNLDPLEHGLIFERFLNPERDSPPDIDLDFDDRRRDEVLQYAIDKYGRDKVAQVITFGRIKTKAAIKDAARVHHGQPGFAIADRISKALPPPIAAKDIPLSGIVDPRHERYPEAAEVRALIETDPSVSQIFDTARGLEGLIRNAGVHACAVILSSQPLLGTVPLWARDDGSIITGWDYPSCEAIGLLKMDFLGLSNLTILGDALRMVKDNHSVDIDLSSLALDDEATYRLLARGESLGVFQFEGGGMRELLKRMQPTAFPDVVAANALYRPGPMEVNAHNDYADRKNGRKPIEPIHPELGEPLEEILAETYGLIVYQEQIMAIAQKVAGYSLGRADILRRAMGKKKKSVLDQEFEGFREGMLAQGYSDEAISTLWATILPFAGYAYNKSHAAGYALVAYWTAYLKANYPAEYMAGLLTSNGDNKDKMAVYLAECRRMGVKVLSPDVNDSADTFAAVGSDIRFGLGAIRNVGSNVVASIVNSREQKGRYASFTDFLDKSEIPACNKRVVESLIKAGAFDSLGHTRMSLAQHHESAVDAVIGLKRQQAIGQFDLFGADDSPGGAESSPLAHLTFTAEEWPRKQLLSYEREMLGLYISAHPLDGAERLLAPHQDTGIAGLRELGGKEQIRIAGMISGIQRRINKNGHPWAIVTLEDLDAGVEVLFFPKSYEMFADCLVEDTAIAIKGRINEREGTISVFASDTVPVDISAAETDPGTNPLTVEVEARHVDLDYVHELRATLRAHRGSTPVRVVIRHGQRRTRLAVDRYPVEPSPALFGELKGLRGTRVLSSGS